MASVAIRDVRKPLARLDVIHGVDVAIGDGEFVVLVGPSGCGKSTLLRMIAGLENITAGEIRIGERVVNNAAAEGARRRHGVPELRALSAHDGRRQHGLLAQAARRAEGRDRDAGQARRRYPRPRPSARRAIRASSPAASASASPWAAPSCATRRCSCSTSRCRTSTPSCAWQMRTEIKELHQRLEDHDRLRHPRPDRGHDHGRQDRGDARRPGRADRRAARALRPAGQPVRRGLHRLAGDELPARHDHAPTAAPAFEGPGGIRLPLAAAPAGSDGRPAVYGIRPEHFAIADDGAEAEVAGGRADRLGDPGRRQARRRRTSSPCSASAIQFKPGDKIRLKPDPRLVHLFDDATGKRLNA